MSTAEAHNASDDTRVGKVDMNLEVHIIPVSDVDRSKQFYERLGWRLDDDVVPLDGLRIVQLTPPGSGTSVTFGTGLTTAAPGSLQGGLVVSDIEAAHDELVARGIDASDVWHGRPFPPEARQPGPDPERTSYGSFFSFNDPDGNMWLVQEITTRPQGGSTPLRRHLHPRRTSRVRFGVPRPPTPSTRSAQHRQTTTGPPGTPRTSWRSRPGRTCRRDRSGSQGAACLM